MKIRKLTFIVNNKTKSYNIHVFLQKPLLYTCYLKSNAFSITKKDINLHKFAGTHGIRYDNCFEGNLPGNLYHSLLYNQKHVFVIETVTKHLT